MVLLASFACAPIVRSPSFVGARDKITDASLLGPFDGQVLDETTDEPISGATVVGIWSYDRGDGLVGPNGSEVVEVKTDPAGRYRLEEAPLKVRGRSVRLVSFSMIVYKRGYVGYRSDRRFDGQTRTDFTLRHNRARLRKWRDTDSHAKHLLFLAPPPQIQRLVRWERDPANVDLYRELGGQVTTAVEGPEGPGPAASLQLLDAAAVLEPSEVRRRTGYTDAFDVKELTDLVRTHFYHGVHMQAVDREEAWDISFRVWKNPPGGLEVVVSYFEATLPDVAKSGDVTDETWVRDAEDFRAVAFLDRERKVGVLLSCGASQCADIETAIILARYIFDNLESVQLVDAPSEKPAANAKPSTKPSSGESSGPQGGPR